MKLTTIKRNAQNKGETNRLRREGYIPAVIYHNGKPGESIAVKNDEYQAILRQIKKGHLPTQKITLEGETGTVQAIIKEIQYHVTSYRVLHLDFEQLDNDVPVSVKVPIECIGTVDCKGVKEGGVLRQSIRHMKIRCLPKDIPETFTLDVTDLEMGQVLRLADITLPETIRSLSRAKEVAVSVGKR